MGNNGALIKRVLAVRTNWASMEKGQSLFSFKWCPVSDNINFDMIGKHGQRNLVNHFENHKVLTAKDLLFINMKKACEILREDVFEYLPLTYVIDF
jgi:hypothetical protein